MWNEDIWGNVATIISIWGQENGLIGDYMSTTIYVTICLTPHQKLTDIEKTVYPIGATKAAREIIKDNWERELLELITRENCQHAVKKQIVTEVFPEFLEE